MRGLEELREAAAEYLRGRGVDAVTAWRPEVRTRLDTAVAVVSLRACAGGPAGFRDYLGERYDPERGVWAELYGRRADVTLGLDLYAPGKQGEAGCAALFAQISAALADGGPEGLRVQELHCGETEYDSQMGLFRCRAQASCGVYLYAAAAEGESFTEFRVKGTRT